ncbi:hypothetical protein SAMN04488061_2878 [Filomicrobium insigne]|uniref:Uncharacterized protein n=1 Tax=Filomicrobium insigne TaxID=418854 RepID=A0A1H0SFS2_9HYPH|nr:hypothetical protein [Filomicrobium insigne]SDP40547.1 hypothetical protein SAMN04488061_2878 [Filomicrobium insigne]
MATLTVTLKVRVAWWVRPYLWAATLFAMSVAPFLDVDDDRLESFKERQVTFIAKHGIRYFIDGRRYYPADRSDAA